MTQVLLRGPQVPETLRTPVEKPEREVNTVKDVTLLVIDYDEALTEANSKIIATDKILDDFEQKIKEGPQ